MIDSLLHARLQPVIDLRRKTVLWSTLALVWSAAALAAGVMVWLQRHGTEVPQSLPAWLVLTALAASAVCWWHARTARPNLRRLARQLESRHPSLDGRLLTAIQQVPDKKGDYGFLQDRLFEDAVRHSVDHNWEAIAPAWRVTAGRMAAAAAMAACIGLVAALRPMVRPANLASTTGGETTRDGVTVTPGDASLERGSTFTVMARFDREVPAGADLVIGESAASEQRVPLIRSLADPVFGGTRPDVKDGFVYRIDYGGRRTRDFRVLVFEFPRLERSDIELTYPGYTGLPVQRIEDTRRVSAVEGTRLAISLQLNKPVAAASLVPKDPKAATLALTVDPARAVAQLPDFPLITSQSYELRLVDADGRSNKAPDLFVLEALPNRPPELKLAAPRGDQRPSALEEIGFEGTAWDDFGVLAYGVAISRGGQPATITQLGQDVPAKEKAAFHHLLQLESLAAKPDELWSWFVWADDIGPDGQRRRTQGDLFFAEVRPFDEIFREGAGMEGSSPPGGQGSPATRLAELQKQIINASWKLQRAQPPAATFAADVGVVRESQQQAIDQAVAAAAEVDAPMQAALWAAATGEMEKARDRLAAAPAAPAVLPEALAAEQSAYQALLKLRERETEVNRSQQPQSGEASAGEQQRQEELDELDLAEAENRYETQRQAQPQQDAERRARMQAQNRLQELAQRQEDVNEKLKELQSALQAAADEPQREELRRQLKRLEEEQRQMLADIDELRQRMDRPEAQSQMSQQRQQLDQIRQDAQSAAEAASRGEVGQALAAGTRAQRQMQEMREQLRQEGAGEMAEELREMRAEARDLARQQKAISESLAGTQDAPQAPRPSLSESPAEQKTLEQLDTQRERTAALVDRATRLSDEAENAEPLVSRQLYDTLRQFSQADASSVKQASQQLIEEGVMTQSLYRQLEELKEQPAAGQALSLTAELLRAELQTPAQRAAGQAQAGLEQLRGGLETAAEKVLGDDTAALETAEKELEALAAAVAQEAAAARDPSEPKRAAAAPADKPGDEATEQATASAAPAGGPAPGEGPDSLAQQSAADAEGAQGTQGTQGSQESQESQGSEGSQASQGSRGSPAAQSGAGAGGSTQSGPADSATRISRLLAEGGEANGGGGSAGAPISGEGFTNWSDRLREVEEMIEFPDLRNAVASARERARVLRLEAGRELKKPDWAVVELEILKPLVEVRRQVQDELRRRSPDEPLAPIDRDPVPERFAELVRRYYEELGRDR